MRGGRIGSGTRWPRSSYAKVQAWSPSARCCATRTWPPPPCTPRSTWTRCARSPRPGREPADEPAGTGAERLPETASFPRARPGRTRAGATAVRGLPRCPRRAYDHDRGRTGLVPTGAGPRQPGASQFRRVGADDGSSWLRPLPVWHRRGHSGPAAGVDAVPDGLDTAVHLLHGADRVPVGLGSHPDPTPAAVRDVPDPDRPAGRQRATDRGSAQARPGRYRLGPWGAADP